MRPRSNSQTTASLYSRPGSSRRVQNGVLTREPEANRFLREEWIGFHNDRFTVEPAQAGTAFVPTHGADLEKIFSRQRTRVVRADNTVSYRRRILQIEPQKFRYSLAQCRMLVCERHCHVNRVGPQRPAWIPFQAAALAVSHTLNASFRNR